MACKKFRLISLANFADHIDASDILTGAVSRQCGLLAILCGQSTLQFVNALCVNDGIERNRTMRMSSSTSSENTTTGIQKLSVLNNVNSFMWNEAAGDADEHSAELACSQSGNLSIYKIAAPHLTTGWRTTCITELHRLTLKGLLKEMDIDGSLERIEVLNYQSDKLMVSVDQKLVIQLLVNVTKPWEICFTIQCPQKVCYISVSGLVTAVIENDYSILLYSTSTGQLIAVVKREKNFVWTSCRMTTDLICLVLQNDLGQLYLMNLDFYFQANPVLLNKPSNSNLTSDESEKSHWYSHHNLPTMERTAHSTPSTPSQTFLKLPFIGETLSYSTSGSRIAALCLSKKLALYTYDLPSHNVSKFELDGDEAVILSSCETIPHLVLKRSQLFAAGLYEDLNIWKEGALLQHIAVSNGWTTNVMSVKVLKLAVESRDLNSVLAFLKAKASFVDGVLSSPPRENRESLETICQLIHTAASTYAQHSTTRLFARQISEGALSFLQDQNRNGVSLLNNMLLNQDFKKKEMLELILERLSDYTIIFKDSLSSISKYQQPKGKSLKSIGKPGKVKTKAAMNRDLVQKWDSLSSKEIVGDGLLMGDIPLLQSYFSQHGRHEEASWNHIVKIGLQAMMEELENCNWPTACLMLKNMGFGVFAKLSQICMYTTDSSLRDYLVQELQSEGEFSVAENQAIQFISTLERLYPCQSFEAVVSKRRSMLHTNLPSDDTLKLLKYCGEISSMRNGKPEISSSHYSHVMLQWLTNWLSHRSDIVIDRLIESNEEDDQKQLAVLSPFDIWSYLCRHNRSRLLTEWVSAVFDEGRKSRFFHTYKVTQDMIGQLDLCSLSTKEAVLNQLARFHVFYDDLDANFPQYLARRRIAGPFLGECLNQSDEVPEWQFISHCLKNNLLETQYLYCHSHRITMETFKQLQTCMSGKELLLLELLQSFEAASKDQGLSAIVTASVTASRYLARHPYLTLTDMLDKQLTDVTLSTLMYVAPFHPESTVIVPDIHLRYLKEHPMLKQLLHSSEKNKTPEELTLYTLLKKWGRFFCERLFNWQMREHECDKELSGCFNDMPHFAHSELVKSHGHTETLGFLHYLKQARPSFAFTVFIAEELNAVSSGSTIPLHRIKLGVRKSHYLAVKHFDDDRLTAACIAFCLLLGEDARPLKLHINTAKLIQRRLLSNNTDKNVKALHCEVESLVIPLVFSVRHAAKRVIDALTLALQSHIASLSNLNSTSIEAGLKWQLAVDFCRFYGLPLPTAFLEVCAHENNWLSFLVYVQMFDYRDHEQLLLIGDSFSNDSIREHLRCVIENTSSDTALSQLYTLKTDDETREKRSLLYEKIGLTNRAESSFLISSSEDEARFSRDLHQPVEPSVPEKVTSTEHIPNDVFAVLFLTNNHPSPAKLLNTYSVLLRNPVLAVLSACHQSSASLECLCSWLIASLPDCSEVMKTAMDTNSGVFHSRLSYCSIIRLLMERQKFHLLRTGFLIFFQGSSLVSLLNCYESIKKHEFITAAIELATFKRQISKLRHSDFSEESDHILTYGEEVSLSWHLLKQILTSLESYLCEKTLQLLDNASLMRTFHNHGVNFNRAYKVFKIVHDEKLAGINCSHLLSNSIEFSEECRKIITALEEARSFKLAREVASLCDMDTHVITMDELKLDIEKASHLHSWNSFYERSDFWSRCQKKCLDYDVTPALATQFFEEQAALCLVPEEKLLLHDLASFWVRQDSAAIESGEMERLQKLIWQSKIEAELADYKVFRRQESITSESRQIVSFDKTQFLLVDTEYTDYILEQDSDDTNKEVHNAVKQLIGQYLDQCKIQEACLISKEFKVSTSDLIYILVCIALALDRVTPTSLDSRILHMIGCSAIKRRSSSLSQYSQGFLRTFSSTSLLVPKPEILDPTASSLSLMERLSQLCEHGALASEKILACYKIAMVFGQPYKDIILQSEYSLLKQLLMSSMEDRNILAQHYISTSTLNDADVAAFLSSTVLNSLKANFGVCDDSGSTFYGQEERLFYSSDTFQQLIKLFKNPSMFGDTLLSDAANLSIEEPAVKEKLSVKVELLIRSHDCYTSAYDMEGISNVLRACRGCAVQLNETAEYSLMVQLLTGIGRFSEMTYIFDTLKQNHRFELLFRKGVVKENNLCLAVLDYLRRFCPGDNDTYRVVSSHFLMHREIAQLLEDTAIKKLDQLQGKPTESHTAYLSEIQKNMTDAAEIYIEGDCLKQAQQCVKQARLVCLQIQLLASDVQVINLDTTQVKSFLINHDKFHEAYIVAEGYGKNEWTAALCNQVLVKGDLKYLNEYMKTLPLSNSTFTEVIGRFLKRPDIPRKPQVNLVLKKFLQHCTDVVVRYKLAEQLELTDVMSELLSDEKTGTGAYIRDVCKLNM